MSSLLDYIDQIYQINNKNLGQLTPEELLLRAHLKNILVGINYKKDLKDPKILLEYINIIENFNSTKDHHNFEGYIRTIDDSILKLCIMHLFDLTEQIIKIISHNDLINILIERKLSKLNKRRIKRYDYFNSINLPEPIKEFFQNWIINQFNTLENYLSVDLTTEQKTNLKIFKKPFPELLKSYPLLYPKIYPDDVDKYPEEWRPHIYVIKYFL